MQSHNIDGAPEAIGPYSHAIQSGNLVFCSGQTPIDPATMKLVGTNIEEQTERVLQNLSIVLEGLGISLQNVIKTTVFLKDMDNFQGMNGVYASATGHGITEIHCPKFGCGIARGDWNIVEKMIKELWVDRGLNVTVWSL